MNRTPIRRLLILLAVTLAALAGTPDTATAHDGAGVITVEATEPQGTSVRYVIRLTWANDGHAALDATLTASVLGPDGTPLTAPSAMTAVDQDGRYEATLQFPDPGDWTVRFAAVKPAITKDQPQAVAAPATTVPTTTTTAAEPDDTTTTEADEPETDVDETAASDDSNGDDGGLPVLPIALGVVVVAAVIVGGLRLFRARHS